MVTESSEGMGVSRANFFKGKYEDKLEFLGGGRGGQSEKPFMGEVWT